jgi:CRISPR-associated protein Cmr1
MLMPLFYHLKPVKIMHKITFHCQTVTPMFLAGADGTTLELRPPSIKGALRWWWRAMNGSLLLPDLQKRESYLFGGTATNGRETGTRSRVIIRVENDEFRPSNNMPNYMVKTYKGKYPKINILYYLAYGHTDYIEKQTKLIHDFIPVRTSFNVQLQFDSILSEEDQNEVVKAFVLLSRFGGLGSKSHNGFGCFRILKATHQSQDYQLPRIQLKDLFKGDASSYSAFSKDTRVFETIEPESDDEDWNGYEKWEEALGSIGCEYQAARENTEQHHKYKERLYVAQPIEVKKEKIDNFLERHAKPFFFNIRKNEQGRYVGRVLYMPYRYLQDNPDLKPAEIAKHQDGYARVMGDFLERFVADNKYFKELK